MFTLRRVRWNDYATYGELYDETGAKVAVTLELPWRNNARDISCVPASQYVAKRRASKAHHGEVFGLVDVPHRDDVELHIGCLPRDTKGCILIGTAFGEVDYADRKPGARGYGITGSGAAFRRLMNLLDGVDEISLMIVDPAPAVVDA